MSSQSYFTNPADNLSCLGIPGTTGNLGRLSMGILKGDNRCSKDLPHLLKCANCRMKHSLQTQQPQPGHLLNPVLASGSPAPNQTLSGTYSSAQYTSAYPFGNSPYNRHDQGAIQPQTPQYDSGPAPIPPGSYGANNGGPTLTSNPSHPSTYAQSFAAPDLPQQQQQQHYQQPPLETAYCVQEHGGPAGLAPSPGSTHSFSPLSQMPAYQSFNPGDDWGQGPQFTDGYTGSDMVDVGGYQHPPASAASWNPYSDGDDGLYVQTNKPTSSRLYDPNAVGEYGLHQGHL
ncbi:hypothetical protein QFC20_006227 [Naganishia adeliensis]|uniref:Uncharacterized protein n=3 Tax=Naganishia adeliensis TaxID=92952 RepID=A0ACC2VD37_9TREE|nr:hypothetical protein QFC20_007635 [Naganishia adeliensis]KAJ9096966.1 hypothetical protein QFC20_006327 [Naganishia adeliensis]KAJ9097314.1 hypothetical protein QFC20_006227 [Naganishia adeliensis]